MTRLVDFAPLHAHLALADDLAADYTLADLRAAFVRLYDEIAALLDRSDDAAVTFIPDDPLANDPFAPPELQHIGWSLAHLVAHVSASIEEASRYTPLIAAGIVPARKPRLRIETDWQTLTTQAQVVQRLNESRRIVLANLDAVPDVPRLDVYRDLSPDYEVRVGRLNAVGNFLFGLAHLDGHMAQIRDAFAQAQAAALAAV